MGLWFKLVSYISLLFFLIELFCSVKSLVCLDYIFFLLLVHQCLLFFFFLPLRNVHSKGANMRALYLAFDYKVGESTAGRRLLIQALSFEAIHSLDLHILTPWKPCSHRCPLRPEGDASVRPQDREEQGINRTSKFLGHVAKHLFIGGNNLTSFPYKSGFMWWIRDIYFSATVLVG